MRCPKCGYISFDHNTVCPRCEKDISAEQAKLNFPAFKPEPPFLLGALTGENGKSDVEIEMDFAGLMEAEERQKEMSLGITAQIRTEPDVFDQAEKITAIIDKKKARIQTGT